MSPALLIVVVVLVVIIIGLQNVSHNRLGALTQLEHDLLRISLVLIVQHDVPTGRMSPPCQDGLITDNLVIVHFLEQGKEEACM